MELKLRLSLYVHQTSALDISDLSAIDPPLHFFFFQEEAILYLSQFIPCCFDVLMSCAYTMDSDDGVKKTGYRKPRQLPRVVNWTPADFVCLFAPTTKKGISVIDQ